LKILAVIDIKIFEQETRNQKKTFARRKKERNSGQNFGQKKLNKKFLTLRNWLGFVAAILLLNIKLNRELSGLDRKTS